jgi:N-acyl-D-aspartate/D-glutamate deacylase
MPADPGAATVAGAGAGAGDARRPALVISNATVFDGSGAPRFTGDVAIEGDRIAAIAEGGTLRGAASIDRKSVV